VGRENNRVSHQNLLGTARHGTAGPLAKVLTFEENRPTIVLQVAEFVIPRTNHIAPRKCTVTEW
jgi:hypothetical protein